MLILVLAIIIGGYALNLIVEMLDLSRASSVLPPEFEGYYDAEKYRKSQAYLKDRIRFGMIEGGIFFIVIVAVILSGSFDLVDGVARSFNRGPIITGLIFFWVLYMASVLFSVPFNAYRTFVIEERYGFNRTTITTFITDIFKQVLLTTVLGASILSAVLWFFEALGLWAWFYSWIAVGTFELFIIFIAPVVIIPLFNKLTPIEEGELKSAIVDYAGSQDFRIMGIYKMDASRRSAKSNAFFIGFGKYKRIVLFDTLISKMKPDELVAVLAHEIGHYKHKDIFKGFAVSVLGTGLMFFLLSFFMHNKDFFAAFMMTNTSVYAGLFLFFAFLYQPINWMFSVLANYISRRFENSADIFSVTTYPRRDAMVNALKRLSVDNLTNLTPHPLKVLLYYSHPPVLERIRSIKSIKPD